MRISSSFPLRTLPSVYSEMLHLAAGGAIVGFAALGTRENSKRVTVVTLAAYPRFMRWVDRIRTRG